MNEAEHQQAIAHDERRVAYERARRAELAPWDFDDDDLADDEWTADVELPSTE